MLSRVRFQFVFVLTICILTTVGSKTESRAADGKIVPIGSKLSGFELTDYQGKKWSSADFSQSRGLAIVFLGTQCPLAKTYASRLNQLEAEFKKSDVAFIAVNPNVQDSLEMMASFARKHKLEMPFLKDPDQSLASALGATRTPEVCLVDAQGKLIYRGRIDDQYGIGFIREAPKSFELRDAITAMLAGKDVPKSEVAAAGCLIGRRKPTTATGDVTYSNQVARILQNRCVECHREGDIGPMDLTRYEDVAAWSDMILEVVRDNRMPPWHANPEHGKFSNDRMLTDEEKRTLESWVASATPRGDDSQLPEPLKFAVGWQLPKPPDVVIPVSSEPFKVPAKGAVRYQYFQQSLSFDEDKWVQAVEIKPGNRAVVHHVLVFDRKKGTEGNIQGHRSFFAGYVPGTRVKPYPEGMAKRLPAGSELIFQVHYTPIGTTQLDQSHLGIVFVDDPSKLTHEIQTSSVFDARFKIPPHTPDYSVSAQLDFALPACDLLSMSPHMHVRGKSFRYTAVFPDGKKKTLLDVPRYDFNWQNDYRLAERMPLPAGTQIVGEAVFDNSDENLNNPDSSQWVTFGEQTWEEMMIGYFHVAVPLDPETHRAKVSVLPDTTSPRRQQSPKEIFARLDKDRNGTLSKEEIPERFRPLVATLDANGDGEISLDEFKLP